MSDALESSLGHPAEFDDDGDLQIQFETGGVFLTADDEDGLIRVYAPLVADIKKTDYASFVAHALNLTYPLLKFSLHGSMLMVRAFLYADPPVADHLLRCLEEFRGVFADALVIADDLDGRFDWDTETDSTTPPMEEFPAAIHALIQFDATGQGDLSAAQVAEICGHDLNVIRDNIRIADEQASQSRARADEALAAGDVEEADAWEREAASWEKAARDLRGGLRVVVARARH
jgi:hypothetical protein